MTSREQSHNANEIAIVGMSCLFPQAPNLAAFWRNIVGGIDCLRDVSEEWDTSRYYAPESDQFNRVYCKRAGLITELAEFDPVQFGVMPNSISGIDPDQLLALRVATEAFFDAGYQRQAFNGERAQVILGRTSAPGGGSMNMIQHGTTIDQMLAVIHALHPELKDKEMQTIAEALRSSLRTCNSDTIPGVMPNILAGRIAGRLGFKGRSLVLDSACASSLIAVEIAIRDLQTGMCDLALAGGVHVNSFPVFFQMFSGLGALSRNQTIKPFDNDADGTLLGEGIGMIVLKRLKDALSANDRIYAIIKGIGSSSDGQGTSMLSPSPDGEALAMRRAYEMAGISPHTIQLLEAHGTATPTGDVVEMAAIQKVFKPDDQHRQWCALGSVKSNIGHTQAASGIAGLIKVALSLYHKVLPATLNVRNPNQQINWLESPCYINGRSQIWVHPQIHPKVDQETVPELAVPREPRRAAVSAFGFGGINAHAVLEEFTEKDEAHQSSLLLQWVDEVCLFAGETKAELIGQLQQVRDYIESNADQPLKDIAFTLSSKYSELHKRLDQKTNATLEKASIVARSPEDLKEKIDRTLTVLVSNAKVELDCNSQTSSGIYLSVDKAMRRGRLAFILPGLGAAYPHMLADLSVHFPDVRAVFDFVDHLSLVNGSAELPSEKIFPFPSKNGRSGSSSVFELAKMDSAVVMLIMAEWALYTVLEKLGIKPEALCGVSTGEFAALTISGASDIVAAASMFYRFSTAVSRAVSQEGLDDLRTIKVDEDASVIEPLFSKLATPVYLGAALSRTQSLISGSKEAIAEAQQILKTKKIAFHPLPTAIPYHTPLVEGHIHSDNEEVRQLSLGTPLVESWSCSTVSTYPNDADEIKKITTKLFTRPIRLRETIESMYAHGINKFIEVGPKGALTPIIDEILQGKPHLAAAANLSMGSAVSQLNHLIATLACHDVDLDLHYLFQRREPQLIDFDTPGSRKSKTSIRLNLRYPEVTLNERQAANLRGLLKQSQSAGVAASPSPPKATDEEQTAISTTNWQPSLEEEAASQHLFEHYLKNLQILQQNMTQMQHQLMQTYMPTESSSIAPQLSSHPPVSPFDLINTGLHSVAGDNNHVQLDMVLTLHEHQYLVDHAIGGTVSTAYCPERVFLLPLTAALELMAEAAALLEPGKVVAKFEHIRAMKRIRVGSAGCRITVSAVRFEDDLELVKAAIHMHVDAPGDEPLDEAPAMSCQIRFAKEYAAAGTTMELKTLVDDWRAPNISPEQLYSMDTMFHGPRMQSVASITKVGKKQILGKIVGREAHDWLVGKNAVNFVTNPLLLDNATQLVLFHLYEHGQQANALLPFLVESLEIHADLNNLRGEVTVFAQLTAITQRGTEANVHLIAADGKLVAQFHTICSRRIVLDEPWQQFVRLPALISLGREMENLTSTLPLPQSWSAILMPAQELPEDDVTLSWCLDYVLHPSELRFLERFFKNNQRRREWISGRIAAKEAVKLLISRLANFELCPADILIASDESGKPWVQGDFINNLGWAPLISLTHKGENVMAIAAHPSVGLSIGVDMEEATAREEDFDRLALSDQEQEMLRLAPKEKKEEIIALLWAAKEAAAKASGLGLRNNPKSVEIRNATYNSEQVQAQLLWLNNTTFDTNLTVHIRRLDSKSIVAITALQPALTAAGVK